MRKNLSVPTVQTVVDAYRREKMPDRWTTSRGYDSWLDNHILPRWGNCPLTDLQPRPVELWLRGLPLAGKSKQHIRSVLSILWDFAMWQGLVPTVRNPIELVVLKGAGRRVRHKQILTPQDFHSLQHQFLGNQRMYTLTAVLVAFGLRISEALALRWVDVDWSGGQLHIQRGVVGQKVDALKTPGSAAPQAISDELLAVLKNWKEQAPQVESENWIFASPWKPGQPLSYSYVWAILHRAALAAGIGHISSHCFRHTYRTWLDSTGTPVGVQQRCMRHSDIRTTMNIYGGVISNDMRLANQKVAQLARL